MPSSKCIVIGEYDLERNMFVKTSETYFRHLEAAKSLNALILERCYHMRSKHLQ
jgi:hypothetical protein